MNEQDSDIVKGIIITVKIYGKTQNKMVQPRTGGR
jgi:hypothetical protein